MKTWPLFWRLTISLALVPFAASCSEPDAQVIGTPESHEMMWSRYGDAERTKTYANETRKTNSQAIKELGGKIQALETQLNETIHVTKDEFETTNEWQARSIEISRKRKADVQAELDSRKKQVAELKQQIDALAELAIEYSAKANIVLPAEVTFFVRVAMEKYDADKGTIDKFSLDTYYRVDKNPSYVVVGGFDGGEQDIFDYDGSSTFSGVVISRDKAKLMREAADKRNLWLSFKAKPKPIQFSDGYYIRNVTHTETVAREGLLDSPTTIAARLIVSALGGDSSSIVDVEPPKTRTYPKDEWKKSKIIKTGWEGTPTPDSFYIYNRTTGKLELIE